MNLRQLFGNNSARSLIAAALAIVVVGGLAFHWLVNRIYVREGQSLLVRYKGPLIFGSRARAPAGQLARVDEDGDPLEIGVLAEMRGPGRHFYCPIWWECEIIDDYEVPPGKVGIVTSKLGEQLPDGQYLVEGDLGATKHRGILRKAFAPGRYRVNPHAYQFTIIDVERIKRGTQEKQAGWVRIAEGHVGVVTNLTDNPLTKATAGVQDEVLPPGIYPVNPNEQHIDVVEIGYLEKTIAVTEKKDRRTGESVLDESGEPILDESTPGISFTSSDGRPIHIDFTAIWGIMPDQAPNAIRKYGNVDAVVEKVILPQIESICRNEGSELKSVDLLEGESRRKFQEDVAIAFDKALQGKDITLLYGLVRYIGIPQDVRLTIQKKHLADELKLTAEEVARTTRTEGLLREAEEKVKLEGEKVRTDTEKVVAKIKAEGDKEAEEIKAQTAKLVAAIEKETAELESQATVLLGQAKSQADQLLQEAKAQRFELAVQAFGSGEAYNQWVFANGLPTDIKLHLLYAGPGTFWTDLKGFTNTMLGRQAQEEAMKQGNGKRAGNGP